MRDSKEIANLLNEIDNIVSDNNNLINEIEDSAEEHIDIDELIKSVQDTDDDINDINIDEALNEDESDVILVINGIKFDDYNDINDNNIIQQPPVVDSKAVVVVNKDNDNISISDSVSESEDEKSQSDDTSLTIVYSPVKTKSHLSILLIAASGIIPAIGLPIISRECGINNKIAAFFTSEIASSAITIAGSSIISGVLVFSVSLACDMGKDKVNLAKAGVNGTAILGINGVLLFIQETTINSISEKLKPAIYASIAVLIAALDVLAIALIERSDIGK